MKQKETTTKIDDDYFELVILHNLLFNEKYLVTTFDHLHPSYFQNKDVSAIIPIVLDFYDKRNALPSLTELRTRLTTEDQKLAYKNILTTFKRLDTRYNEIELLENTEKFLRERAVYCAVKKTIDDYAANNVNTPETLDIFQKACSISLIDSIGYDYFNQIEDHCKYLVTTDKCIPTGWKWLDKKLGGGWMANGKALYVFTGIVNVGKSVVLGNCADNVVSQNLTAAIITLEMSENVYAKRVSSQLSKIPIAILKEKIGDLKQTILTFKKEHSKARLFIKEYPPKSVTVHHFNAYLKKLEARKCKPDVLIIDYINLIKPTNPTGNSYEDLKAVSEQLRALSYLYNIPIITATQFHRGGFNVENPGMEHTSESMGIPMTCDAQISLYQLEGDAELGIIRWGILKNRFEKNEGNIAMRFDYNTLRIEEDDSIFTNTTQVKKASDTLTRLVGGN